jgi:hypothetical protein
LSVLARAETSIVITDVLPYLERFWWISGNGKVEGGVLVFLGEFSDYSAHHHEWLDQTSR